MTTQVAVSNRSIEESVAAGQHLCTPRGASHGFSNSGNQDAEVFREIISTVTRVQYFGEPIGVFDTEFGGELARF